MSPSSGLRINSCFLLGLWYCLRYKLYYDVSQHYAHFFMLFFFFLLSQNFTLNTLLCIKTRFSWLLTCGRVHSWHVDMWNAMLCHRGTKSRFWDVRNTRVSLFRCFKFMLSLNCESPSRYSNIWVDQASKKHQNPFLLGFWIISQLSGWVEWLSIQEKQTNKHAGGKNTHPYWGVFADCYRKWWKNTRAGTVRRFHTELLPHFLSVNSTEMHRTTQPLQQPDTNTTL